MDLEVKKLLLDIKEAIESIEEYLGDKREFSVYNSNKMLRRAVEREFEIIGEAVHRMHNIDPLIEISSKGLIIGMRNRVIHGYDKVDDEIVWGAIIKHLPVLKTEVIKLME